jgi:hypothetical protein
VNARDTSHELFEQLAVGHALNALEPEDEQAFLHHVLGCAACERAVAEHLETLTHLAFGVSSPDAPPASILEGIRAGVAESGRAGAFPAPVSLDAARTRRQDRTVRWTTAVLGAAASIVLLAALVFVNQGLKSREHDATLSAANLNSVVDSLLVNGSRKVELAGANGSKGVVVVNGTTASLVIAGVPANDSKSVYVLWEKYGVGKIRHVKTFDVTSGRPTLIKNVDLGSDVTALSQFVVTREAGRTAPAVSQQPAVVAGNA